MSKTIDCTPTWAGILPALLLVLESGNAAGKRTAKQELHKMAQAADLYNDYLKKEKIRQELKDFGILDEMTAYDSFEEFYVAFMHMKEDALKKYGENIKDLTLKYTEEQLREVFNNL